VQKAAIKQNCRQKAVISMSKMSKIESNKGGAEEVGRPGHGFGGKSIKHSPDVVPNV